MQPTFRQTPPRLANARPASPACRGPRRGMRPCSRRGRHPSTSSWVERLKSTSARLRCVMSGMGMRTVSPALRRARRLAPLPLRRAGGRRCRGAPGRRRQLGGCGCGRCAAAGSPGCGPPACAAGRRRRPGSAGFTRAMTRPWTPCRRASAAPRRPCPRRSTGTSIDALSVSSVTSGVSTSTASPALTSTSTTATSLKLPSPERADRRGSRHRLEQSSAGCASVCARKVVKRAAERAVDHAVIVGERQRQHQPRHEAAFADRPAASPSARRRGSPPRGH